MKARTFSMLFFCASRLFAQHDMGQMPGMNMGAMQLSNAKTF